MAKYNYQAKTKTGRKVSGLVQAGSLDSAVRLLHQRELVILSVTEKKKDLSFTFLKFLERVSSKDITRFTRQLATMISVGLTLTAALRILEKQSKPIFAEALHKIVENIEGGSSFHKALEKHPKIFASTYIALVKSGETSGKLDKILLELAELRERQEAFKSKVKGALIYPVLIMTAMVGVGFLMMVFVIPKLSQIYKEMDLTLPIQTQILIAMSDFMTKFWYIMIAVVFGGVYGFMKWKKTPQGKKQFDRIILKIPVLKTIVTKIVLTQAIWTLSLLIKSGISIIDSLDIVAEASGNIVFQKTLEEAAKDVEKGFSLTDSLEKYEEYPDLLIQMIAVGEETGRLGEVMERVAVYYEQESEAVIKGITTAIEPAMIIILGVAVGFMVMSIITPIYKVSSQF